MSFSSKLLAARRHAICTSHFPSRLQLDPYACGHQSRALPPAIVPAEPRSSSETEDGLKALQTNEIQAPRGRIHSVASLPGAEPEGTALKVA